MRGNTAMPGIRRSPETSGSTGIRQILKSSGVREILRSSGVREILRSSGVREILRTSRVREILRSSGVREIPGNHGMGETFTSFERSSGAPGSPEVLGSHKIPGTREGRRSTGKRLIRHAESR